MANISIYIYRYTPRNFNALPTCTVRRNFLLPSLLWHFLAREENNLDTKLEDKNIVHVLSAFEDKNHRKFTHMGRGERGEGIKETDSGIYTQN